MSAISVLIWSFTRLEVVEVRLQAMFDGFSRQSMISHSTWSSQRLWPGQNLAIVTVRRSEIVASSPLLTLQVGKAQPARDGRPIG